MELKNSGLRTRVFGAALALGLIIGAQSFFSMPGGVSEKAQPTIPSGEDRRSPGKETGLRPDTLPGISLRSTDGSKREVAKPTASQLSVAWKQSTIRLKYLDRCQASGNCVGFNDSEAYSYDIDVRKQQAQEIRDFTRIARAWQFSNGGAFPEEAVRIARYFLNSGDDETKEAAFELISNAPVTTENLHACLYALETSASAPLMKDFMKSKIVAACNEPANASMCTSFIRHTMRMGGENLQKEFARHSLEITNERTAPLLAQIERQQDPRSLKRLYLRANRQEWERMQRGG